MEDDKEESLLAMLSKDWARGRKHSSLSSLVHTGSLGRGVRGSDMGSGTTPSAPELLRRLVLLELMGSVIRSVGGEPRVEATGWLAAELVAAVSVDAVAGAGLVWGSWDEEKASLERLVGSSRRLSSLGWVWEAAWGLVAESPTSLWRALPLLKARLGATLAEMEAALDKSRGLSGSQLSQLQDWLALTVKGGVLPVALAITGELLPFLNLFEAIALLLEIWRYLQVSGLASLV